MYKLYIECNDNANAEARASTRSCMSRCISACQSDVIKRRCNCRPYWMPILGKHACRLYRWY